MAFCKRCGAEVSEDAAFCPNCRESLKASTWTGSVFDTFVNSLVASLIITFTCGIATPWAICYMMKFIINHMVIDGKTLRFEGTGTQLFGKWLKWYLLTLITCGIYSFWVAPDLYRWVASHIHSID